MPQFQPSSKVLKDALNLLCFELSLNQVTLNQHVCSSSSFQENLLRVFHSDQSVESS